MSESLKTLCFNLNTMSNPCRYGNQVFLSNGSFSELQFHEIALSRGFIAKF